MKTICWITSGYLLQVDLPLLCHLKKRFNIKWCVYADVHSDMARHAQEYAHKNGIELTIMTTRCHGLLPMVYLDYREQMKMIRDWKADIYYFDTSAFPYLIFAIKKYLPAEKVVMAMHHGTAPDAVRFRRLYQIYLDKLAKEPFTFQYFSKTQGSYFTGDERRKHVIELSLNDYGHSSLQPPTDKVVFLYFGIMISSKFVDGIIKAAQLVKQRTDKPFTVKLVGYCRNWTQYQSLIKDKELFDLRIERIPDADIPDLLSTAHYQLLPYTCISQSGALRMAYGYNLPVITSDLDGFKESVINGVTGKLCKAGDIESLANAMLEAINNHPTMYEQIRKYQAEYVEKNYSQEAIVRKYVEMFNAI